VTGTDNSSGRARRLFAQLRQALGSGWQAPHRCARNRRARAPHACDRPAGSSSMMTRPTPPRSAPPRKPRQQVAPFRSHPSRSPVACMPGHNYREPSPRRDRRRHHKPSAGPRIRASQGATITPRHGADNESLAQTFILLSRTSPLPVADPAPSCSKPSQSLISVWQNSHKLSPFRSEAPIFYPLALALQDSAPPSPRRGRRRIASASAPSPDRL
jgi:hypothetical protein